MKKCLKCGEEVEYPVFDICKSCHFKDSEKYHCEICGLEISGKTYYFNRSMCLKCSG